MEQIPPRHFLEAVIAAEQLHKIRLIDDALIYHELLYNEKDLSIQTMEWNIS